MVKQAVNWNDETLTTALAAIELGVATIDQLQLANDWRRKRRPQIGKLALIHGKLTVAQVFDVLSQQAETGGLFGQTAVQLGFMTLGDLYELLQKQAALTPTLADALVNQGVISPEQALLVAGEPATSALEHSDPVLEVAPSI